MKALLTRKIGMTSAIDEKGAMVGITLLSASPNTVTQIKTDELDRYKSVQLGFEKSKKLAKPQEGHLKKASASTKIMHEFRLSELPEELKVGDQLGADLFNVGDTVKVTGISKGKGFAGTIKRHNFARGRKTHGGRSYRRPGSIGSMYPQRIFPGKKMSGQMGYAKTSTKGLKIALVDTELNVIGVVGSVPGPKKGLVIVDGGTK